MPHFLTDDILHGSNWRGLERAVARVLIHLGWDNVMIIGKTGDKGGDVLGTRPDCCGKLCTWVIQVKSVKTGNYVGVSALNESIGALSFYDADVCAVATNATFTQSAINRKNLLISHGFNAKLWNGATLCEFVMRAPSLSNSMRKLREYQIRIHKKILQKFDSGDNRGFFIVATGLGKTVIAASIAKDLWERGCKRILVLCHSRDLAFQLEQGFWPMLPKEIPTSTFVDGLPPRTTEGIAFGLFQSLAGYTGGIDTNTFDAIIVDEAHHASATTYRACLSAFRPRFLLGMTATPWRGDGASLTPIFGEPVETVSLVDGMNMGYLAKVDYRIFCDNISWEYLQSKLNEKISIRDLNKHLFIPQRDEAVISEIKKTISTIDNPRIAIFSPSIEHCTRFSSMLCAEGISCVSLTGNDKAERRRRLMSFSSGKTSAIAAVELLNEGIDIPDVNVLVFLRATHSRRIFIQQLGRGLRISEDKEKVIVLDFVSDVRRIADVIDMNNEGKVKGKGSKNLYLQNGFVTFTNKRIESFVNMWLEDIANLGDVNENIKLNFPDKYAE